MVLLINPPVVKPCEPPPGIALIGGALRANGVRCTLWDANLECMLELFRVPKRAEDRWTARAARNVEQNLNVLRSMGSYGNGDRYRRAVSDLNRLLSKPCFNGAAQISLTNYQDRVLSPLRSRDLLAAAEFPEKNAFFPFFSESLVSFLERENPSLVGISLNYLSQALPAFAMMGFLRRMDTSLTLVLGGGLITSWMSAPGWKDPFEGLVDHTIAGPGERFFGFRADSTSLSIIKSAGGRSGEPMSNRITSTPCSASSASTLFSPAKKYGLRFATDFDGLIIAL